MAEYIKREDLLELYRMDDPVLNENGHVPLPVIRQNIMDIPAADVAPVRHGRWIFGKDLPFIWGKMPKNKYHLYCSECLEQAFNRSEDNDPDFDVDTPYCPFCGCCMDGGVDE